MALLIEEIGFRRYRALDLLRLTGWGLVEALWFRPPLAWWRLRATVLALIGRRPGWGTIPRGAAILDAIARGREAPPIPRERGRDRFDSADAPLISLTEALLRARAAEAGLAYELIASRGELELIVAATRRGDPEPDVRTVEGWRSELVGADLRALLSGRKAVSVGPGRRLELSDR